jgi:hypothetical protein
VDFVAIDPARGAIAIEVKGGLVHATRGVFRQVIAASGQRKGIDPFGQLKFGFARVCDAAGVDVLTLPVHWVIWFPHMAQSAFTWKRSPHIWTREACERGAVRALVAEVLPQGANAAQIAGLQQVGRTLRGSA